jgi:Transposase DDE domain
VLFDAWYPSKAWLERIGDYGGYLVCRLKKNRGFEGRALHKYLRQPYWQATGFLSGKIKVRVLRYRRKYSATNRLSLTAPEVRPLYRLRQEIEEVIRVLKSQLNLEGCQAGYTRSTEETTDSQPQPPHIALCLVAYLIVEHERFERRMTWRQFKRHLILKKPHTPLPALERLRMAA